MLRASELEKTVDQRGEVKKSEKKVEHQTRVGVILVPFFLNERDGFHGKKKTCAKQERDNAEKGDKKKIGPIIPFAVEHVKRRESCAQERRQESCDGEVICLSEMLKFHAREPRAKSPGF